jgi:hypothetical protein
MREFISRSFRSLDPDGIRTFSGHHRFQNPACRHRLVPSRGKPHPDGAGNAEVLPSIEVTLKLFPCMPFLHHCEAPGDEVNPRATIPFIHAY